MACPTLDHSLFQKIRSEHEKILLMLERWRQLETDEARKKLAVWLWEFVELKHHAQEESLVFQSLYAHPKIGEGGPMCTLYFDFHMADNPLERAQKLTNTIPPVEPHQQAFYEAASPVRIPLEEHRGGKEILRHLLADWANLSEDEKNILMKTYKDIQTQHIAKEETCFFHLCLRLLSQGELDQLAAQWVAA